MVLPRFAAALIYGEIFGREHILLWPYFCWDHLVSKSVHAGSHLSWKEFSTGCYARLIVRLISSNKNPAPYPQRKLSLTKLPVYNLPVPRRGARNPTLSSLHVPLQWLIFQETHELLRPAIVEAPPVRRYSVFPRAPPVNVTKNGRRL